MVCKMTFSSLGGRGFLCSLGPQPSAESLNLGVRLNHWTTLYSIAHCLTCAHLPLPLSFSVLHQCVRITANCFLQQSKRIERIRWQVSSQNEPFVCFALFFVLAAPTA